MFDTENNLKLKNRFLQTAEINSREIQLLISTTKLVPKISHFKGNAKISYAKTSDIKVARI